ncbi:MAG: endonuclease MutS2 [Lachnospiraceae bacterium]|nr:endonuclease MutS2 [Lachnospiraceae bacterium]
MNEKALKTLEYQKIIQMLTERATSPAGRAKCAALKPSDRLDIIRRMQKETTDAAGRVTRSGSISFGDARLMGPSFKRLEVGGTLSQAELLSIADLLDNCARVKSWGAKDENAEPDAIDPYLELLDPLPVLSAEIRRCILSEDEISDSASPKLRQIRQEIHASDGRIHSQLNSIINGSLRTYLMEPVVTMRDGRYCLPVRAEYKNSFPGMVHDQSSTGATLFIEPMSVVKLNNEVRELFAQEKQEIARILAELSAKAAAHTEFLISDLENMAELDFICARALLSLDMKASEPAFNTSGQVDLRQARHPLIDAGKVVPIDVRLGDTFDLLVITGPNTGGKTVTLKTVGLLTLMGESGLHIPAAEHSRLALFREVYADIGDEQSIEQSLSTFSSHMTNVVSFLGKADRDSLVLFDELGAGTDPTEGAVLAISILSWLHERQIRTIATTHYSELKIFALSTEGVENASCEFDVKTLRPTYRLLIGVPGKSNAFAISKRLGLSQAIIDDAAERIGEQDKSFEDVLATLEQNRIDLERRQQAIERQAEQLDRREKQLHEKERELENRKDAVLEKANVQAHAILQEAKDYADQTMKDFRRFGKAGVNADEMERKRTALRQQMSKTEKKMEIRPKEQRHKELQAKDLHKGDTVKILSLNLTGTVSTLPDNRGYLYVQTGIIRTKVSIRDLELVDEDAVASKGSKAKHNATGSGTVRMSKALYVSPEINLLGKTVDEATAELDKYLDDARLAHLETVRVIHGKGTGALRKGIHDYLRRQHNVKDFHLAEYGEGDAGVTIVKLR